MKLSKENLYRVNFHGLVLVFSTKVSNLDNAGKLHAIECSVAVKAMNNPRAHYSMDGNQTDDTVDLLDRGYGVTLCKCAKHHVDVK